MTKFFDDLYDRLCETDYITPFKDRGDIVDRLLPFAFNFEPDYSEEYLAKGKSFWELWEDSSKNFFLSFSFTLQSNIFF